MTRNNHPTEVMMNGLIRVSDTACGWAACYRVERNANGRVSVSYAHGGTDCREYRDAALAAANRCPSVTFRDDIM